MPAIPRVALTPSARKGDADADKDQRRHPRQGERIDDSKTKLFEIDARALAALAGRPAEKKTALATV